MQNDSRLKQPFLRLKDIIGDKFKGIPPLIPVSRSQWLKGVNAGIFPQPVKISPRILVWKIEDIVKLMQNIESGAFLNAWR